MFPTTGNPVDLEGEQDLKSLGAAMKDSAEKSTFGTVAGMTYFGQFIDHDLTYDTTKLGQRGVEPSAVPNFRTPCFDLELIYGQGPELSPELYEVDRFRLKIGKTAPSSDGQLLGGTLRDIARRDDHTPLHADPNDTRNLENLLVMQIHVLFMKFHNAAVEQCDDEAFKSLPLKGNKFQRAQQLVRWHYQWLVRECFLSEVVHHAVLADVRDKPKINWHEKGLFIPAEFSMAAFRFGHSMVRKEYDVNCHHPSVPLADLMVGDDPPGPLREDWLLEWGHLFGGLLNTGNGVIASSPINTAIAEPLHHLPEYTKRQHSDKSEESQPKQLPARTLLRGARAGLPTGQEVAEHLVAQGLLTRSDVLTAEQLIAPVVGTTNDASGSMLAGTWMLEHTPLYYYLLKEAEVLGHANHTLGPIGSRIVAEVIETVLRADRESYFNTYGLGPNWERPLWRFRDGGSAAISSFTDLVQMLGDELPQGCHATFFSKANAVRTRWARGFGAIRRAGHFSRR